MNRKSKNITKTVAVVASALVLGVAGLFADQITTTIFNKYFQLGAADGAATLGDEIGSANILHSSDSNIDYNAAPDWANIMVSTGSASAGGDDRTPKTPRGVFNPNSGFDGEGAFVTDDASAGGDPDLSTYVATGTRTRIRSPLGLGRQTPSPIKMTSATAMSIQKRLPHRMGASTSCCSPVWSARSLPEIVTSTSSSSRQVLAYHKIRRARRAVRSQARIRMAISWSTWILPMAAPLEASRFGNGTKA